MTEQQIIEHIGAITYVREVDTRLREVRSMQDYLHALQGGEKQASAVWVNSSALLFPEDFEEEMNGLNANLVAISKLLEQLGRIETALTEQRGRILKKR
jgi:hypothetical protein